MNKVSILTYWGVANYGAWTQAYALNNVVRDIVGSKVEVEHLDYLEQSHYDMYYKTDERLHNAFQYSWNIIPHSKHYDIDTIENEKFDTIITGADSIWTLKRSPGNADYHLAGYKLNAKRMIAYAPSSGIHTVEDGIEKELEEGIKRYDEISVRDETTAQIVEQTIGYKPKIVVDPALLWDFKKDCIIELPTFSEYIVVYGVHWTKKFIEEIVEFARKEKLMLISVGFYNDWCDLNMRMIELRGTEWIGFFAKAEYVVTSTFHGLMVGLAYEKQIKYCQNDFTRNRSETLINDLGIVDMDDINQKLNYTIIGPKLNEIRNASKEWLERALNAEISKQG